MTLELLDIAVFTLACALLAYLWRAQLTREIALRATKRHLKDQQLQLLDENVALKAIWIKRDQQQRLHLWRRYHFEFSVDGETRYPGTIVTLGNRVETIHLAPHRMPDNPLH
ncbi:MAG: DUF3301 domain-containing protein [Spongiibacteraceae bacterium]